MYNINLSLFKMPEDEKSFFSCFKTWRSHLEKAKKELLGFIDANFGNAEIFRVPGKSAEIDFTVKPSEFINKAYVVQEYDEEGMGISNRIQTHISAGVDFVDNYEKSVRANNEDVTILYREIRLINKLNELIAMINKTNIEIKKGQKKLQGNITAANRGGIESEIKERISTLMPYVNELEENCKQSKLIELTDTPPRIIIDTLLSICASIVNWIREVTGLKDKEFRQKFADIKGQVKEADTDVDEYSLSTRSYPKSLVNLRKALLYSH